MTDRLLNALGRRRFLIGTAAAGGLGLLSLNGCSYYPAEHGDAFAPWSFPNDESRPEFLAVGAAILAASPHNTQPWLFDINPESIDLYADLAKSLGAMDGQHREMYLGLGCALENLVIAARANGREPTITYLPTAGDETHVARIALAPAEPQTNALYDAITRRHTNRGLYADQSPPAGLEAALRELLRDDSVHLTFLSSAAAKRRFRDETIAATEAIVADDEMHLASHGYLRHGEDAIDEHRDGITIDNTGVGSTIRFLAKSSGAPSAETTGQYWLDGTRDYETTGAAFCILSTGSRDDRQSQVRCGRVYQRMHLWATGNGLAMQPLNQLAERQDREQELGLSPRFTSVLEEMTEVHPLGAQLLFRIGYAWDDARQSARRPIGWVTR